MKIVLNLIIQKLEWEVDMKYRNILVIAFKGKENTEELILLKDIVEPCEGSSITINGCSMFDSFIHDS